MAGAQAVVLFAHGSRDPVWRRPLEAVAERVRARAPDVLVRCAFLELDQPGLPEAGAELAAAGATQVTIVPMFLGAGRHVRDDLPALVHGLRQAHPSVRWECLAAVGEHPALLDLLAQLAVETLDRTDAP